MVMTAQQLIDKLQELINKGEIKPTDTIKFRHSFVMLRTIYTRQSTIC